jgi:hypothetical protein
MTRHRKEARQMVAEEPGGIQARTPQPPMGGHLAPVRSGWLGLPAGPALGPHRFGPVIRRRRTATRISDPLVVPCADHANRPVVRAGTLYR